MFFQEVLLQSVLVMFYQVQGVYSSGVLTVRLGEFKNPSGRTYDGTCCDPLARQDDPLCSDQCDYVMRLIVTGLGRANDHVFLFHRPLKYDSNNIEFDHNDNNLLLTVLFDHWPEDGLVKMNAFFYDYDDFDHTTTLVDWFETDLKQSNFTSASGAVWGQYQQQTVVGNRQLDKTLLTFDWSIMHPEDELDTPSLEEYAQEMKETDLITARSNNVKDNSVFRQEAVEVTDTTDTVYSFSEHPTKISTNSETDNNVMKSGEEIQTNNVKFKEPNINLKDENIDTNTIIDEIIYKGNSPIKEETIIFEKENFDQENSQKIDSSGVQNEISLEALSDADKSKSKISSPYRSSNVVSNIPVAIMGTKYSVTLLPTVTNSSQITTVYSHLTTASLATKASDNNFRSNENTMSSSVAPTLKLIGLSLDDYSSTLSSKNNERNKSGELLMLTSLDNIHEKPQSQFETTSSPSRTNQNSSKDEMNNKLDRSSVTQETAPPTARTQQNVSTSQHVTQKNLFFTTLSFNLEDDLPMFIFHPRASETPYNHPRLDHQTTDINSRHFLENVYVSNVPSSANTTISSASVSNATSNMSTQKSEDRLAVYPSAVTWPVILTYLSQDQNPTTKDSSFVLQPLLGNHDTTTKQDEIFQSKHLKEMMESTEVNVGAVISTLADDIHPANVSIKKYMADMTLSKDKTVDIDDDIKHDSTESNAHESLSGKNENETPKLWYNAKKFQKSNRELLHDNIQVLKAVKFQTAAPVMWFVTAQRPLTQIKSQFSEFIDDIIPEISATSLTVVNSRELPDIVKQKDNAFYTIAILNSTKNEQSTDSSQKLNIKEMDVLAKTANKNAVTSKVRPSQLNKKADMINSVASIESPKNRSQAKLPMEHLPALKDNVNEAESWTSQVTPTVMTTLSQNQTNQKIKTFQKLSDIQDQTTFRSDAVDLTRKAEILKSGTTFADKTNNGKNVDKFISKQTEPFSSFEIPPKVTFSLDLRNVNINDKADSNTNNFKLESKDEAKKYPAIYSSNTLQDESPSVTYVGTTRKPIDTIKDETVASTFFTDQILSYQSKEYKNSAAKEKIDVDDIFEMKHDYRDRDAAKTNVKITNTSEHRQIDEHYFKGDQSRVEMAEPYDRNAARSLQVIHSTNKVKARQDETTNIYLQFLMNTDPYNNRNNSAESVEAKKDVKKMDRALDKIEWNTILSKTEDIVNINEQTTRRNDIKVQPIDGMLSTTVTPTKMDETVQSLKPKVLQQSAPNPNFLSNNIGARDVEIHTFKDNVWTTTMASWPITDQELSNQLKINKETDDTLDIDSNKMNKKSDNLESANHMLESQENNKEARNMNLKTKGTEELHFKSQSNKYIKHFHQEKIEDTKTFSYLATKDSSHHLDQNNLSNEEQQDSIKYGTPVTENVWHSQSTSDRYTSTQSGTSSFERQVTLPTLGANNVAKSLTKVTNNSRTNPTTFDYTANILTSSVDVITKDSQINEVTQDFNEPHRTIERIVLKSQTTDERTEEKPQKAAVSAKPKPKTMTEKAVEKTAIERSTRKFQSTAEQTTGKSQTITEQTTGKSQTITEQTTGKSQPNTEQTTGKSQIITELTTGKSQTITEQTTGKSQPNTEQTTGKSQPNTEQTTGKSQPNTEQTTEKSQPNTEQTTGKSQTATSFTNVYLSTTLFPRVATSKNVASVSKTQKINDPFDLMSLFMANIKLLNIPVTTEEMANVAGSVTPSMSEKYEKTFQNGVFFNQQIEEKDLFDRTYLNEEKYKIIKDFPATSKTLNYKDQDSTRIVLSTESSRPTPFVLYSAAVDKSVELNQNIKATLAESNLLQAEPDGLFNEQQGEKYLDKPDISEHETLDTHDLEDKTNSKLANKQKVEETKSTLIPGDINLIQKQGNENNQETIRTNFKPDKQSKPETTMQKVTEQNNPETTTQKVNEQTKVERTAQKQTEQNQPNAKTNEQYSLADQTKDEQRDEYRSEEKSQVMMTQVELEIRNMLNTAEVNRSKEEMLMKHVQQLENMTQNSIKQNKDKKTNQIPVSFEQNIQDEISTESLPESEQIITHSIDQLTRQSIDQITRQSIDQTTFQELTTFNPDNLQKQSDFFSIESTSGSRSRDVESPEGNTPSDTKALSSDIPSNEMGLTSELIFGNKVAATKTYQLSHSRNLKSNLLPHILQPVLYVPPLKETKMAAVDSIIPTRTVNTEMKTLPEHGFKLHASVQNDGNVHHSSLQELPTLQLSGAKSGTKRTNIQTKLNLDKLRDYMQIIRYRPTVKVPSHGLYTPKSEVVNLTEFTAPVLPKSVERYGSTYQPLVGVSTVFTRYWPAVLGVTIGTTFLLTALITSILCRQRRLLIQRARWLDSPQHLSEPPDPSEYATSSAASLTSDLTRSSVNLIGSRHGSR
ncbi:mucin-4 [Biomphalaria pfeifferi]|uniref:Mucin-4 n=1 Tax=Biomphalaria pfeifferi TaxID=112525 RepID=A0AAD8CD60_BIOPF|nr:mucin-4 [Biomphalaria pfeifferi]